MSSVTLRFTSHVKGKGKCKCKCKGKSKSKGKVVPEIF